MRMFATGVVIFGLAVALTAPAFATGKQIICRTPLLGIYIPFWGDKYSGMRFQTLVDQAWINYGGKINQIEFYNSHGVTGTFNAYKLILCHCGSTSLSSTFASNYKGTPVKVADLSSFTIPNPKAWFGLGMTTTTFDYNNADHLLIEIQWLGSNRVGVPVYCGSSATENHRVYLYNNPTGPEGTADSTTYYIRLSFGFYTPVTPTSLGRVKALFK